MHPVVFPVVRAASAGAAFLILLGFAGQTGASRFALAQVLDPTGKALVDVGPDDFVVQEAGAEREILDMRVADYPVAIVVDNGSKPDFDTIRAAVVRMLERLGPRPIAVVTAGGEPKQVAAFDDERETVMERLKGVEPAPDGVSRPLQATAVAAEAIKNTGALFSAILVITSSPVEVSGAEADALLAPIIDSRAVTHVVTNAGADEATRRSDTDGARRPDTDGARRLQPSVQLLRTIADQTHGDFRAVYSAASYQPAVDRLVARLTTELLIEYLVPVGSRASDVKIGVRIPGARVRGLGVAPR
jgi:hypothetical protein